MAKRIVRLTERELISLVKRVVSEQKIHKQEMEEGFFSDKFGWIMDAAREIAKLFREEIMPEIPEDELEDLKSKAKSVSPKEMVSSIKDFGNSEEGEEALEKADEKINLESLNEGLLNEEMGERFMKILTRTGILSGLGILGTGFLTFMSHVSGFIDFHFLVKVYEITDPLCGAFCGPLGFLAMVVGILIALGSINLSHSRKLKKENYHRRSLREGLERLTDSDSKSRQFCWAHKVESGDNLWDIWSKYKEYYHANKPSWSDFKANAIEFDIIPEKPLKTGTLVRLPMSCRGFGLIGGNMK